MSNRAPNTADSASNDDKIYHDIPLTATDFKTSHATTPHPPLLLQTSFHQDQQSVFISLNPEIHTYFQTWKDQESKKCPNETTKKRSLPSLHLPLTSTTTSTSTSTAISVPKERKKFDEIPPSSSTASFPIIPETVLQYERQMRKLRAASKAQTPLVKEKHLHILYQDDDMVVVNKPSGVLCVPGVNQNPSIAQLVYNEIGPFCQKYDNENEHEHEPKEKIIKMKVENMIVHRLDMDTSGVVVFARTMEALKTMQKSFRDRTVEKTYEALICGHMTFIMKDTSTTTNGDTTPTTTSPVPPFTTVSKTCHSGKIDLPLQRDHRSPPFMRIATPQSEYEAAKVVHDLKNHGWKKIIKKKPKQSTTLFEIINDEEFYQMDYPATRIKLTPITGRTHQLRVHLAAIGYPIIGDPAYGIMGEASPNGGVEDSMMEAIFSSTGHPSHYTSLKLQQEINIQVQKVNQCMCLHARELKIAHPKTGEMMVFEAPPSF